MIKEQEIDWRSPLAAFAPLAGAAGAILLHGGARAEGARWSFIAARPARQIAYRDGSTTLDGAPDPRSPFELLRAFHEERRIAVDVDCGAPLISGLVGFVGYECAQLLEPAAAGPPSPYRIPDFWFGAYDAVAAFDRARERAFLFGRTRADVADLESSLGREDEAAGGFAPGPVRADANFSQRDYEAAVADVIERIRDGELFQANLSRRIDVAASRPIDSYGLFCAASAQASGAYGAFVQMGEAQILSLSPERFFIVRRAAPGLSILAAPIKGTRPRGSNAAEDSALRAALAQDPKERAENIMIADLIRNDLSRVCADHSIREEAICEVETHATLHHLVSRIGGVLREGCGAVEALTALFPCGSVTGAPKVQAMKTIAAIERGGRGPYCGAIGYIDDRGGADLSVAIRLAVIDGQTASMPVGGGVTLRSDPAAELAETLVKARHFLALFGLESAQ
jgi:para-aminobenzoate synthetase component 1